MEYTISPSDIERKIDEAFSFDYIETSLFVIAMTLPSWPKSFKKIKIEEVENLLKNKLDFIFYSLDKSKFDAGKFANFLASKCIFTCDIAKYAEKISGVGRLVAVGKFYIVNNAMKEAVRCYFIKKYFNYTEETSLNAARDGYWRVIIDALL